MKTKTGLDVGYHIGIDQKTLLVRKIGHKMVQGRTDRQNEVWAGKTVNMSAKLASVSDSDVLVSERFYENLTDPRATHSCGCNGDGVIHPLWAKVDVRPKQLFDFDFAYSLTSNWCKTHGSEYCEGLLKCDVN